ncbi:Uncharacterised protein [Mycobacterium tuberculosis]|uniref:Uncharacterized protein n=1 Tax=Mycobacterium tuberculosis TaxID=1773 RepID=A0A655EKW1_MYCTX|nr:Uncharacterised protein [Mycobacterium tuberculosis]CNW12738.1 Uncharacterised protein [Mycobacterium tuberculosis]
MDDRGDPRGGQRFQAVGKGEERIRGCHRAANPLAAAFDGQPGGVDTVDLTHPDADGGAVGSYHYRVRLDRTAGSPREDQVGQRRGVRR